MAHKWFHLYFVWWRFKETIIRCWSEGIHF